MPTSCRIFFNENPAGVYYSGQTLSGRVSLMTFKAKSIRGIYIAIKGHAEVRWTETRQVTGARGQSTTETVYFLARDDYFNSRVNLLGNTNNDRFDLLPGEYEYNFQMQLPFHLPSSFVGQFGTVRYQVSCIIDRPWQFDNVFKCPFTVISPLDLNANPQYMQPLEIAGTKAFSKILCCGHSGRVIIRGNISCGGFVPGQVIPFSMFIKNDARVSSYETNACLKQLVEYRSYTPYRKSKFESKTVTVNHFGPMEKYQEKQFSCNLQIPSIAPTSFQTCAIIEITYFVVIQFKTRGLHSNLKIKLPITIGTIPCFPQWNRAAADVPNTSAVPTAPEASPPSYEEAIRLGPDYDYSEEDKYVENVAFQPRYPVYNMATIPTMSLPPHYDSTNDEFAVITTQPEVTKEKF